MNSQPRCSTAASASTDSWRRLGKILGNGQDDGLLARLRLRRQLRLRLQQDRRQAKRQDDPLPG